MADEQEIIARAKTITHAQIDHIPMSALDAVAVAAAAAVRADWVVKDAVLAARANGATWPQIGAALGVTKQAAMQRFSRLVATHDGFSPADRASALHPAVRRGAVTLCQDMLEALRSSLDSEVEARRRGDAIVQAAVNGSGEVCGCDEIGREVEKSSSGKQWRCHTCGKTWRAGAA